MSRQRRGFSPAMPVWTKRSDANGLFFPLLPARETSGVKNVRAGLELINTSGNLDATVGWELSDDGESWPASTAAPGTFTTAVNRTTEGATYATAFEDIGASMTKKYVRFGVLVKNTTGTVTMDVAICAIRIEIRAVP